MKVILDCVFNHSGESFGPWVDVKKNGELSKYKDWFHVNDYPVNTKPLTYVTFGFFGAMPKLNTSNPEVVKYLIDVARYWVAEFDVDGWRLDVANEVDHKFWRKFCRAVRKVKPDSFILGELWHNALLWVNRAEFDSTMHYPLIWKCEDLILRQGKPSTFANEINELLHWYPEVVSQVLFTFETELSRYSAYIYKMQQRCYLG